MILAEYGDLYEADSRRGEVSVYMLIGHSDSRQACSVRIGQHSCVEQTSQL